ncbi:MAG TPA: PP2C family protein-serine/threonine phosphatase [Tepidisphaeraceae bacterium]|nr:PP2C family protein-serine/threonine phosphatase [Tepidisphaeraceae bacterium]
MPSTWYQQPWPDRLSYVVDMMREISRQADPQGMVQVYGRHVRRILPSDGHLSLSRRDLVYPWFRITRSHLHRPGVNPWKERGTLPTFDRGILSQLIYDGMPRIIDDFEPDPADPAYEYLRDIRSIAAIPLYEAGLSLNMVVMLRKERGLWDYERFPDQVWLGNLFGRATSNLVLSEELRRAYDSVDRELKTVADIQRSLPTIPGVELATYYQTSQRAGGDYYDFFELPEGQLGILIADVAGHGTPAAVMMAVTHSIAHGHHGPPTPPSRLLNFLNHRLASRYTGNGTFVTAFYGIFDPRTRKLVYTNAGHNPPVVRRCGATPDALRGALSLPLGIIDDEVYRDTEITLAEHDVLALYTDGITEARRADGEMFGTDRLNDLLCGERSASETVKLITHAVDEFTGHTPASDDRTLLLMRLT